MHKLKKNGFHLIYFKYINKESSLCSNLFSTIALRNYSDQEDVITNLVEEDLDSKNRQDLKIIRSVITDLLDESIQSVKLFDFFQISGKVMNICEDNCCFDFYCSNCFKNDKIIEKSNLAFQKTTPNKQKLMFNTDSKYARRLRL